MSPTATIGTLSAKERSEVFDGLLHRSRCVEVYYAWRPNLPDEADHHLIELGVAAQAEAIVTRNLRDVASTCPLVRTSTEPARAATNGPKGACHLN